MKRSFLKNLGVDKDLIDEILDENGKDLEAEKEKAKVIQDSLDEANTKIANLEKSKEGAITQEDLDEVQADLDAEKAKVAQLETEKEELSSTFEKNHQIDLGLIKAGAKNLKAVKALLSEKDLTEVSFEEGKSEKLDTLISGLKESDPYLFEGKDSSYEPSGGKNEPSQVTMHDAVAQAIQAQGVK